ncbi:neuroligin-4, Y-linked-like [Palaemon carinicauda]|uniref:neuroligin-4, Y-linked-like n=1 Tax=Palaemon carinicauda TaxID=392227 RepID=UPI0035B621F2
MKLGNVASGKQINVFSLTVLINSSILCDLTSSEGPPKTPAISTKYGQLRGFYRQVTDDKLQVATYLGIPYATPPIGANRFSPTRALSQWMAVHEATHFGPSSLKPHLLDPSTTPNWPASYLADGAIMAYPVVVFIHGESFEWGSSSLYDGSVLAALGKVIVVTLNYRLGILGMGGSWVVFLSFYNANADRAGHPTIAIYGLMDQLAALHWVQENIVRFGGDPGKEGRTPVDLLLGMTAANLLDILSQQEVQEGFDVDYREDLLRSFIVNNYPYHLQEIMLAITAEYTDWSRSLHQPISIRDSTGQGLHDAYIVSPMADLAKQLYTTSRSSYLYVLEEEVSNSGNESILLNELVYVFGCPLGALGPLTSSYNFTKMDVTLSKSFISMWSNFIKLG